MKIRIHKRSLAVALSILVLTGVPGRSQNPDRKGWGYFFASPGLTVNGDTESFFQIGGGGGFNLAAGLGADLSLGVALEPGAFSENELGIFSPGLSYHFNRDRRTTPFVSGGYTLFFRNAIGSGAFWGVGADHWLGQKIGLRFEIRDQIFLQGEVVHFLEGRVALLLR